MIKVNIAKLSASVIVCILAGGIGSLFTSSAIPVWYEQLKKPAFNPPNWVFGPVWTILFILMGIALYLVWDAGINTRGVKIAMILFGIQLLLNIGWSIIFFGLRSPLAALIEIFILLAAIAVTTLLFYNVSHASAYLMIPYLIWVSFAAVLNFSIVILNL